MFKWLRSDKGLGDLKAKKADLQEKARIKRQELQDAIDDRNAMNALMEQTLKANDNG